MIRCMHNKKTRLLLIFGTLIRTSTLHQKLNKFHSGPVFSKLEVFLFWIFNWLGWLIASYGCDKSLLKGTNVNFGTNTVKNTSYLGDCHFDSCDELHWNIRLIHCLMLCVTTRGVQRTIVIKLEKSFGKISGENSGPVLLWLCTKYLKI